MGESDPSDEESVHHGNDRDMVTIAKFEAGQS
jgi:hypothetical protein